MVFFSRPLKALLRLAVACAIALAGLGPATAQVQRAFPAGALRGVIAFGVAPEISLNGRPARLGPGARIRDAANLSVVPSVVIGSRLLVHYTLDPLGLVREVWILTPQEAAKQPWPTTPEETARLVFDADAQVWSRP